MSENLLANHYQENKERLQKMFVRDEISKLFPGRKRKKPLRS